MSSLDTSDGDSLQEHEIVRRRPSGCLKASIVSVMLLGLGAAILVPAILSAREAARKSQCQCRFKQIGLALQNYLAAHGTFPPAYTVDPTGKRMHSWRALILPSFEGGSGAQYDFSVPWNDPKNRSGLLDVSTYCCPSDQEFPGPTNRAVVVGAETMWPGTAGRLPSEIKDGLSNTFAAVEVVGGNIPWQQPVDLEFARLDMKINPPSDDGIACRHPKGANFLLADGSVRFIKSDIKPDLLRALLTAAGGEPVSPP